MNTKYCRLRNLSEAQPDNQKDFQLKHKKNCEHLTNHERIISRRCDVPAHNSSIAIKNSRSLIHRFICNNLWKVGAIRWDLCDRLDRQPIKRCWIKLATDSNKQDKQCNELHSLTTKSQMLTAKRVRIIFGSLSSKCPSSKISFVIKEIVSVLVEKVFFIKMFDFTRVGYRRSSPRSL